MIDKRVIAHGEARFQGEVIAAVAAVDEETAERAVSLIDVEYEVLPPVLTIDESEKANICLLYTSRCV